MKYILVHQAPDEPHNTEVFVLDMKDVFPFLLGYFAGSPIGASIKTIEETNQSLRVRVYLALSSINKLDVTLTYKGMRDA